MTKLNWKDEITLAVELAYEAHPYPKDYQYKGDEYKRDEVIKDVTDQILTAFKAHIEEKLVPPTNPIKDPLLQSWNVRQRVHHEGYKEGFDYAVEWYSRNLMESLG